MNRILLLSIFAISISVLISYDHSAFATNAPTFLFKFGSFGSGSGQFIVPSGITIDNSGSIYVVDSNNLRVEKFDSSANFILAFGSQGSGSGQFNFPNGPDGIAVDSASNLYVADFGNGRVEKFDSNGNFLSQIGSHGFGDGQFCQPNDIAIDNLGFIYVSDTCRGFIKKFDSSGNFVLKFSAVAWGITFDPISNAILGADPFNDKIQKFDLSGNLISEFGSPGSGAGQFNVIRGLVVDRADNIYVADQNNNRVQQFDSTGHFLLQFGSSGSGDGQFFAPSYIAISKSGNLFITDGANNRVQVFVPQLAPLIIKAPPNLTINTDPSLCSAAVSSVTLGTATSSGGVGTVIVAGTRSDGLVLTAPYPEGTTTITWTATDSASPPVTVTGTQTVTVVDKQPPSIAAPPAVSILVGTSSSAIGTATASDNCPGVTVSNNAPATFTTTGITTVTWTATDSSGNSASATQLITVLTPAQATQDLINQINSFNIDHGITSSLDAKLNAAVTSLNSGQDDAAKNQLKAFENYLQSQRQFEITQAIKMQWMTTAQNIIGSIGR